MGNVLKKLSAKVGNRKKQRQKEQEKKGVVTISEDAAMEQVSELLDYYDIDLEILQQSDNFEMAGEMILKKLIGYYMRGQFKNNKNEKGFEVIQTLGSGTTITYKEITAKAKRSMDKSKSGAANERLQLFMCALGENLDLDSIDKLKPVDLAALEVLGYVFLQA